MNKILVTGGRKYQDKRYVFLTLDYLDGKERIDVIIEGGAPGADTLARDWAHARQRTVITCYAEWNRLSKPAGVIRNGEMLKKWEPDLVVAYPGGVGTADMIERSHKAGVEVMVLENK